jgi:hypothetical protein
MCYVDLLHSISATSVHMLGHLGTPSCFLRFFKSVPGSTQVTWGPPNCQNRASKRQPVQGPCSGPPCYMLLCLSLDALLLRSPCECGYPGHYCLLCLLRWLDALIVQLPLLRALSCCLSHCPIVRCLLLGVDAAEVVLLVIVADLRLFPPCCSAPTAEQRPLRRPSQLAVLQRASSTVSLR